MKLQNIKLRDVRLSVGSTPAAAVNNFGSITDQPTHTERWGLITEPPETYRDFGTLDG